MPTKKQPTRKGKIPAFIKRKPISAQSKEYVKGYKLKPLSEKEIFDTAGIKKEKGKYYNQATGRSFKSKETALNYSAKQSGFSSWDKYKEERKTRAYKQFEKRARQKKVNTTLGKTFAKQFAAWKKSGYVKKSEELRDLLTTVKWIDEKNYARYV